MADAPGFPARRAALQMLDAVMRRGVPLESALGGATQTLAPPDKALARAIASETLRWLPDLDAMIDAATRLRLPDDSKARMVLRLALAQALAMKTPPHAVIATALPLIAGGPRRLVHGVLGAILRQGHQLPESPALPAEVEARWREAWGEAMIADVRKALAQRAPLDLAIKDAEATTHWAARLRGESLAPGHVRLRADSEVTALPGFAEGAWWVQGLTASEPARWLGAGEGRRVLDLCAAPGGKTMQLAAAGWKVTALDSDAGRLQRVAENLARTRLKAQLVAADLLAWEPPAPFPAILLDAPCSATGTFARHPEVLYRARPQDIAAMAERQSAMIARAADWLAPGGALVYATCSLEPQEGEHQVTTAQGAGLNLDRQQRILPAIGRDGFFIARFLKA